MVEIYKTNVRSQKQATKVIEAIQTAYSGLLVNFDLQDCDKILRIQNITPDAAAEVEVLVKTLGFRCNVLN